MRRGADARTEVVDHSFLRPARPCVVDRPRAHVVHGGVDKEHVDALVVPQRLLDPPCERFNARKSQEVETDPLERELVRVLPTRLCQFFLPR